MDEHKFCKYLSEQGVIGDNDIYNALNIQRSRTRLIGQIALQERYLTIKEVFRILDEQTDNKRLFCEIAIDLGYLTNEDVESLLLIQSNEKPSICDLLLEISSIEPLALSKLQIQFAQSTAVEPSK